MAPAVQEISKSRPASEPTISSQQTTTQRIESKPMSGSEHLLDSVARHRVWVLLSPFALAALLIVVYRLGGSEIRQVLDFFSPRHLIP